jgi:hypothetical protein
MRRGAVFVWRDYTFSNDPAAPPKAKYVILVNAFLPDEDVLYYVLTTSKTEKLLRSPFANDVVVFRAGSYEFFGKETAVNVGTVAETPTRVFRGLYYDGDISYVGCLSDSDMARIDEAISASLRVPRELKRSITPW